MGKSAWHVDGSVQRFVNLAPLAQQTSTDAGEPLQPLRADAVMGLVALSCRQVRPVLRVRTLHSVVSGHSVASGHSVVDGQLLALHGRVASVRVEGAPADGPCSAKFSLFGVSFVIEGSLKQGTPFATIEDVTLYTLERRGYSRIEAPHGAVLTWPALRNGAPDRVECPVIDFSPAGVRVRADERMLPLSGAPFAAQLKIGKARIRCLAVVKNRVAGGDWAGLALTLGRGRALVASAYMAQRFPQLQPRRSVDARAVAELFRDSGYLKLRDGEGPSAHWHALDETGSKDVVYVARDGVLVGHISATRAYDNTWMMHQLATRGGHPETGDCRRLLYDFVSSVPRMLDGERASVLAYFDQSSRWHQRFFADFVPWVGDEALVATTAMDRFERTLAVEAVAPAAEISLAVSRLQAADAVQAVALVRAELPPLFADVFQISVDQLCTNQLARGLERRREVFTLHVGDSLKGVALCETGSSSASLFNLLNAAQFFFCSGESAPTGLQQLHLLAAVRRYYASHGVAEPVIMAPVNTFQAELEVGTTRVEAMGCVVIRGPAVRQWENYCKINMGQLYQRKKGSQNGEGQDGRVRTLQPAVRSGAEQAARSPGVSSDLG